jgi:hypothetical protein
MIPAMASLLEQQRQVEGTVTSTNANLETVQEEDVVMKTRRYFSRRLPHHPTAPAPARKTLLSGGVVDLFYHSSSGGAYDYGYKEAEMLWNSNSKYTCTTVFPRFWLDVKKPVFAKCDSKWMGFWQDSVDECKDGASDFVLEQIGDCATTADCYQLGIGAAAAVAGSFCRRESLYREREWLPRECEKYATTSCQCDVVNLVQEFIDGNVCGSYTDDSALDYIDELYRLCVVEIEEMENEVKLE